jgi:hypothetical protein
MIGAIFNGCVLLLLFLADRLGMTYKAINVWIFVIIWPVITLTLTSVAVRQWLRIRELVKLKREIAKETHRESYQ